MSDQILLPKGAGLTIYEAEATVRRYLIDQAAAVELYDRTNPGPHDEVTPTDLLALNALNAFVRTAPMEPMAALWSRRSAIHDLIRRVGLTHADVTSLNDDEVGSEIDKISQVLALIEVTPGWGGGGTRTAKLLHRLRPGLVPIWDELVGEWYGGPAQPWPEYLQAVFTDVRRPATKAALSAIQGRCCPFLTALRVWDVLLWKTRYDAGRR
jgi:hypothetical protein